jgi:uncharacterized ion transporter superfamily protein YfcC
VIKILESIWFRLIWPIVATLICIYFIRTCNQPVAAEPSGQAVESSDYVELESRGWFKK